MRGLRALFLCMLCFAAAPIQARAGVSEQIKSLIKDFNSVPRTARQSGDFLSVGYVEVEGRSFAFSLPWRFARLSQSGETFRLERPRLRFSEFVAEVRSSKGAKLQLSIQSYGHWPETSGDQVVALVIAQVFDYGTMPVTVRIAGNAASRVYHLNGCNHLPDAEQRAPFADEAEAIAAGFRACPICFNRAALPLPLYGATRSAAENAARIYEMANPPVADSLLQAKLTRTGEKVLSRFPSGTHGYNYRFRVVQSELPGATSYSTGFVYITKPLWDAVEDSLELEQVLAHEIAHVEEEPEDPMQAPKKSDPQIPAIFLVEAKYARSRARELQKDLIALEYIHRNYPGPESQRRAGNALLKLQFFSEGTPEETAGLYDTHPSFGERFRFFDPEQTMLTSGNPRFVGLDEVGDTLVVIRVIGGNKNQFTQEEKRDLRRGARLDSMHGDLQQAILLASVDEAATAPLDHFRGKFNGLNGHDLELNSVSFDPPIQPGRQQIFLILSQGDPEVVKGMKSGEIATNLEVKDWYFFGR